MEDAPGKPDPTGLFAAVEQLEQGQENSATPVIYAGDTVADMQTVREASALQPQRLWLGVGILPPHVQQEPERALAYREILTAAGAKIVLGNIQELTPHKIQELRLM